MDGILTARLAVRVHRGSKRRCHTSLRIPKEVQCSRAEAVGTVGQHAWQALRSKRPGHQEPIPTAAYFAHTDRRTGPGLQRTTTVRVAAHLHTDDGESLSRGPVLVSVDAYKILLPHLDVASRSPKQHPHLSSLTMGMDIETTCSALPSPTKPRGSVATFSHLSYEVKTQEGMRRLVDDVSVKVSTGEVRCCWLSSVVDGRWSMVDLTVKKCLLYHPTPSQSVLTVPLPRCSLSWVPRKCRDRVWRTWQVRCGTLARALLASVPCRTSTPPRLSTYTPASSPNVFSAKHGLLRAAC